MCILCLLICSLLSLKAPLNLSLKPSEAEVTQSHCRDSYSEKEICLSLRSCALKKLEVLQCFFFKLKDFDAECCAMQFGKDSDSFQVSTDLCKNIFTVLAN